MPPEIGDPVIALLGFVVRVADTVFVELVDTPLVLERNEVGESEAVLLTEIRGEADFFDDAEAELVTDPDTETLTDKVGRRDFVDATDNVADFDVNDDTVLSGDKLEETEGTEERDGVGTMDNEATFESDGLEGLAIDVFDRRELADGCTETDGDKEAGGDRVGDADTFADGEDDGDARDVLVAIDGEIRDENDEVLLVNDDFDIVAEAVMPKDADVVNDIRGDWDDEADAAVVFETVA